MIYDFRAIIDVNVLSFEVNQTISENRWRKQPPSHFKQVWREKFAKPISKLSKESLRTVTHFLTGHCELNYHIEKFKPDKVSKTCPHCLMEEETINHFIGQCPKWA